MFVFPLLAAFLSGLRMYADDVESAGPNGFGMVVLLDGEVHCADAHPVRQLDPSHATFVEESVEPTADLRHQTSPLLSCWKWGPARNTAARARRAAEM